MGDITISTAPFTFTNMLLGGTDTLTSAWGTNLANNTGYLANQPISLWQHYVQIEKDQLAAETMPVNGWLFPSKGTWTIYYSMTGVFDATRFVDRLDDWSFPDITIDGSFYVLGLGTWTSMAGSFTAVFDGGAIPIKLSSDDAGAGARIAGYVSIFGVRNGGVIT